MATTKKRHTAEQIVNKLRQVDVELSKGATIALACKAIGTHRLPVRAKTVASRMPRRKMGNEAARFTCTMLNRAAESRIPATLPNRA